MGAFRVPARLLNLNADGTPRAAGTVIVRDDGHAYLVEASGAFRRVQILEETAEGVRYRVIQTATKAEKKAQRRERQRARSAVIDAALRVAQQAVAHA